MRFLITFLRMKKLILAMPLIMVFFILVSCINSAHRLKETRSLMQAMGALSSETHMLYCEEKFNSISLIKVVVDFDNHTIMTYGRYHTMAVDPKTDMFFTTARGFNVILTKNYVNQEGIPSLIMFTFNKVTGKYFIASMNAITDDMQWRHDVVCK